MDLAQEAIDRDINAYQLQLFHMKEDNAKVKWLNWLGLTVEGFQNTEVYLKPGERALPVSLNTCNATLFSFYKRTKIGTWFVQTDYYRANQVQVQRFHRTIQARLVARGWRWEIHRTSNQHFGSFRFVRK